MSQNLTTIRRDQHLSASDLVFTNSASTTAGFAMGAFAGGMLLVSSATLSGVATLSTLTLSFLTKRDASDATALAVADDSNTPITLVVQAGRAYALPDVLFSCTYVLATTATGTVTCRVLLKA